MFFFCFTTFLHTHHSLLAPGVRAKNLIPNIAIIGNCRLGNRQGRHSLEGGEINTQAHYLPRDWHQSKDSRFVWGSFFTEHPPGLLQHAGWGVSIITQILHGYPLLDLLPEAGYIFSSFVSPNLRNPLINILGPSDFPALLPPVSIYILGPSGFPALLPPVSIYILGPSGFPALLPPVSIYILGPSGFPAILHLHQSTCQYMNMETIPMSNRKKTSVK